MEPRLFSIRTHLGEKPCERREVWGPSLSSLPYPWASVSGQGNWVGVEAAPGEQPKQQAGKKSCGGTMILTLGVFKLKSYFKACWVGH